MIDFRYHLVSIVAIFLALTVGIVLGTTMLQDPLLNTLQSETSRLREESEELRAEKDVAEQLSTGNDQLVDAYAEQMLADQLTGTRVVIVETPGVDEAMRDGLVNRVQQAGGTVPGRLVFAEEYGDPEQATFVDELVDQLAQGETAAQGGAYERAGMELARALIAPTEEEREETGEQPEEEAENGYDAAAVLAGFSEAGLLTVHGDPAGKSDIALVLAPAEPFTVPSSTDPPQDDVASPANTAYIALTRALRDAAEGAVLVGGATSVEPGGIISQARSEESRFATVDTAGTVAGDVVAALALAISTEGRSGNYGVGEGVDAFLPDPLPRPNESEENTTGTEPAAGEENAKDDGEERGR
ncbi:copper transporter [Marinactinospora thermotolerans]|uniref:Copper transport outer membrane protein, MctB n=1 Tax=Marinactinospora thermotolerans DSM 45154 TaxID=1122192 RepID=A0A1T4S222_9ACTN|nr:copper transporter [Marinactinospora thermotolerans]SKA21978.1 Copper transport outer membrane protein, MctB [Marinactinospora thermotolerans DSM 45154]